LESAFVAERPHIAAALVDVLTTSTPKRIVRKLDERPAMAEEWMWEVSDGVVVVTRHPGEAVTLRTLEGVLASADQIACTCLLSPRCLHVLAVVARLPIVDVAEDGTAPEQAESGPDTHEPSASQRDAARRLWHAAAAVLALGATATGAMQQADLLRAVHSCRIEGLYRAASVGVRVVQGIRDLRDDRPQFRLAALTNGLCDLLLVAWRLSTDARVSLAVVGQARRRYAAIGNVRWSLHRACPHRQRLRGRRNVPL
jgi:hypothetical protein